MSVDSGGSLISVCLLTYNHVNLIESTLGSILDQSLSGYEVIVSDDCSDDGTWEKILEIAKQDARIRPVRTSGNLGMSGNANFAVCQSSRRFIALLHHDDLYRRDLLESWLAMITNHADMAFVFNAYESAGAVEMFDPRVTTGRLDGAWFLSKVLFPRWGCAVRGTAFVRRSAWNAVGGMRTRFGLLADVDLWMRLSARWAVGYVAEPLISLRQERPDYYPEEYKAGTWSWERQRYLLEIHGLNRQEYYVDGDWRSWARLYWFRNRLSADTLKWLGYAIVKNKPEIIESSDLSKTEYDLWWLRIIRGCIKRVFALGSASSRRP